VKMIVDYMNETFGFLESWGYHRMPAWASLSIIATILGVSVLWSVVAPPKKPGDGDGGPPPAPPSA
jgi:hypothetical protein